MNKDFFRIMVLEAFRETFKHPVVQPMSNSDLIQKFLKSATISNIKWEAIKNGAVVTNSGIIQFRLQALINYLYAHGSNISKARLVYLLRSKFRAATKRIYDKGKSLNMRFWEIC
jgi:site-specific recombinase XerD